MNKHFCTCPVSDCPRHPQNHSHGCDPCIKDNIRKKKMPACMFVAVHEDVSEAFDYSIEGFVDFYLKHKDEFLKTRPLSARKNAD